MKFNKSELERKLISLELYLSEILEVDSKVAIVVIGGASLIINELTERQVTSDIDVFVADPDEWKLQSFSNIFGEDIAEEIEDNFDINSDVYFFKLEKIIPDLKIEYIKFESEILNTEFKYLDVYTLNIEGIVFTKLLAMMNEDPDRDDRDYFDIKDLVNKVDHSILNGYIKIWKKKFARVNELEKFDKAYNRWKKTKQ